MKGIGAFVIVAVSISVGLRISAGLRCRCNHLKQLLSCLEILKNEISFYSTQLPSAFELLAIASEDPLKSVFRSVSKTMMTHHWMTPKAAMEQALESNNENLYDPILLHLSDQLGKYDMKAQLSGISVAETETRKILNEMEQERKLKSRTYQTLSLCTGVAIAILLI